MTTPRWLVERLKMRRSTSSESAQSPDRDRPRSPGPDGARVIRPPSLKTSTSSPTVLKVILVGETGVGKTSLLQRFTEGGFCGEHIATVGIDFKLKKWRVGGRSTCLQLWDTSGEARFRSVIAAYFKGAEGVGLVADLGRRESLVALADWARDVRAHAPTARLVLVGNKADLSDHQRQVSHQEAAAFAASLGAEYQETSALSGSSVRRLFGELASAVLETRPATPEAKPSSSARPSLSSLFRLLPA